MKVGDLVMMPRASIGIPAGSMALIVGRSGSLGSDGTSIWKVHLIDRPKHMRRFLQGDLELVASSCKR